MFTADSTGLDIGDQYLDKFLAILRVDHNHDRPWTTEEIMRWLLINPGDHFTSQEHLTYLALVCATAMQRLTP